MATFFSGNPFATPVGIKIEQATSEVLPSEDWGLNLEICDMINETEDGPKDAIKAIRKRITMQPKNYSIIMYTLIVLETCVKNCGKRFHVLACSKDFIQELVKLIGPKNGPPAAVQEKVLSMIQSWSDTFKHHPELSGVSQVYADLKHKGVAFPMTSVDAMAPIITPQRTVTSTTEPHPPRVPPSVGMSPRHGPISAPTSSVPVSRSSQNELTPEQMAKLHSELDVVESNSRVLSEMLAELVPGKEHPEDLALLQDLNTTCCQMQQRVVELVGKISDDNLTAELLRINDNLNNLFLRYDRYMNKVRPVTSSKKSSDQPADPQVSSEEEVSLINLDEDILTADVASLSIGKKEESDFDVFAQSRKSDIGHSQEAAPQGPLSAMSDSHQTDGDFDEMENWLQQQNGGKDVDLRADQESAGTGVSMFDAFMAERAAAAEHIPTISAVTGSNVSAQKTSTELKQEKELFSL